MRLKTLLTISILSFAFPACNGNSELNQLNFAIVTNAKKNVITNGEMLSLSVENKRNHKIDSVHFALNGKAIDSSIVLNNVKLGEQRFEATVFFNNTSETVFETITILNSDMPKVMGFNIINEYPHDITSYTQGLEFYKGELYESTGQLGQSKLRKVNYKTAEVLNNIDLSKDIFGEGLSILNDKIYQLSWQAGMGFIYDVKTFQRTGSFKYGQSKEGWGLCNDDEVLYKSDGTEKIWILDPETLVEKDYIQAYTNKGKIVGLNELEWIDGKIYANRYQKNGVAIINPENGAIEGVIDFTSLQEKVTQHPKLDVLNGIAYNPDTKTIFVTGKNWDKLFEVEIIEN